MDQFVCARIPKANAIDLTVFQFDYDLTFAVFFMNADRTIYGRYGTRRSREDATHDMSLEGLAKAMSSALQTHKEYPSNRHLLNGKQAVASKYRTPDDYPSLRGKYRLNLDYAGELVKSCLHCHQIGEAERLVYRTAGDPIPDAMLYPYPLPDVIGFSLDPTQSARVSSVEPGSAAAVAGFQVGDDLLQLDGQMILSIADVQWVLHHADDTHRLPATVRRGNTEKQLEIALASGWRQKSEIAWRSTNWSLRRMGTGGMVLEALPEQQRRKAGLDPAQFALLVKHAGRYGAHGHARRVGVRPGDILLSFDGRSDWTGESQILAHAAQNRKPGDEVPITVLRGRRQIKFQLQMQD